MKTMDFAKGVAVGITVSSAVWAMMIPKKKCCKNIIAKALRAAGDTVENISSAMGM